MHAERRKKIEFEEKDEFMKLLVFLIRPDIYEEMDKKEKGTSQEVEMVGLKEIQDEEGRVYTDLDEDKFKSLVREKTERLTNIQTIATTTDGEINEYHNPDAFPLSVERT